MKSQTTIDIPIERIDRDVNVRTIPDQTADAGLQSSIGEHGVLAPVGVIPVPETGRWRLVCGHRRVAQSLAGGIATVPAFILEGPATPEQLTILQLTENVQRSSLHPWDLLNAVGTLAGTGWSGADLSKALSVSEATVSRWCIVARDATPAMMERIKAGALSLASAYELCKLPAQQRDDVINTGGSKRLTREAITESLKRPRTKRAQSKRSISVPFGRGHSVTFRGKNLTLDDLIQWLGELLARATRAKASGENLRGFAAPTSLASSAATG